MRRRPPTSKLFPYTTLFRSKEDHRPTARGDKKNPAENRPGNRRKQAVTFGRRGYFLPYFPDRKRTRLNSSHGYISYAVFCLKKKKKTTKNRQLHHLRIHTSQ